MIIQKTGVIVQDVNSRVGLHWVPEALLPGELMPAVPQRPEDAFQEGPAILRL